MSFKSVKELRPSKEHLIQEYLNKLHSASSIAKEIGVGETTLFRWLESYGIKRRTSYENQHPPGFKEPTKEKLYDLHYNGHKSLNEIAKIYGVSWNIVKRWFKKYELKVKSISEIMLPKGFVKPTKEELIKLLDSGLSTKQISLKYRVNSSTILHWIHGFEIPISKIKRIRTPYNKVWSKEKILIEINKIKKTDGNLSAKSCRVNKISLYNAGVNYFGSWAKAVIASGIDYYEKIAINKNKYWTKENIIKKIIYLRLDGFDLNSKNIRESNYSSLYDAAKIKFGSWENAINKAGINYQEISRLKAQTKSFKNNLRKRLTKEKLKELYEKEGYSTIEIGLKYGVSPTVIGNLLKKHHIELKRPKYGYKKLLKCKDGHKVKSNFERNVCDWMFDNKIDHLYEPNYPKNNYYGRRFRADFKVGKFYIEILGMLSVEEYAKKFEQKTTQFWMVGGTGSAIFEGEKYDIYKPLIDKENKEVIVIVKPENKKLTKEEINRQLGFLILLFSKK